jgi:hypothetical protein
MNSRVESKSLSSNSIMLLGTLVSCCLLDVCAKAGYLYQDQPLPHMKLNRTGWLIPKLTGNCETGFFYVKNFNISQEEIDDQFALGREFYALPLEEKLKFHSASDLERGEYNSYRPAGHRMYEQSVRNLIGL